MFHNGFLFRLLGSHKPHTNPTLDLLAFCLGVPILLAEQYAKTPVTEQQKQSICAEMDRRGYRLKMSLRLGNQLVHQVVEHKVQQAGSICSKLASYLCWFRAAVTDASRNATPHFEDIGQLR